jgi:hypothetical protein
LPQKSCVSLAENHGKGIAGVCHQLPFVQGAISDNKAETNPGAGLLPLVWVALLEWGGIMAG